MRPLVGLAFAVALSACVQALPETRQQIEPDANGLAVAGTGLRIDFGRAPSGVVRVMDRAVGPHEQISLTGCPDGIRQQARWGDLVLSFTHERFVGWQQAGQSQGLVCHADA